MRKHDNAPELKREHIAESISVFLDPAGPEKRQIVFSASSDKPLDRWFGVETLDHSPGAVRMERIEQGSMPLLFNHDPDHVIGMVTDGRLEGGRLNLRASLFDTERAREVEAMLAGGLRNVSIGYEIHEIDPKRGEEFFVTDWTPYEASIVSIPADHSVGLGRSKRDLSKPVAITRADIETADTAKQQEPKMADLREPVSETDAKPNVTITQERDAQPEKLDFAAIERKRKESISKLARANNLSSEVEHHWIKSGADMDTIADDLVSILEERGKQSDTPAHLGLSKKETRQYSILKGIRAAMSGDWSKAGLELEAHKSMMARDNLQPRADKSFFVPMDVQARTPTYNTRAKRDLNVAGAGGLVGTDHLGGSFIDLLRNTSVVMRMGATRLTGLRGNVAIPRMTAGTTAYWLADETTAITESQPTINQLTLSPHNVAALTEVSHQLMQQSDPSAEQMVLADLAQTVALAADVGALRGDATGGQPQGIVGTVGLGAFTGTALDYAAVLEAQTDVAAANVDVNSCAYVTAPAVAALLMQRVKFTGTASPIWDGNVMAGDCAGLPGMSSNQMAAATMLFGWWQSLVLAEWGVLELAVNPTQDFTRGLTGLRAWYTMDVGLRYPAAFSYASTIT